MFSAFDADGNGSISTEELRTVILYLVDKIDEEEVEGIIKQIDREETGEIDYQGSLLWWISYKFNLVQLSLLNQLKSCY